MSKFTRFGISMMVGASIVLSGSTAFAALDKCQATLEKNGLKLTVSAVKALNKCKDAVRKGQLKGKDTNAAAGACEKALGAVLGIPGGIPAAPVAAKTKIGKFVSAIAKADSKGTCNEADLFQLGHLISGLQAPGTRTTCTDSEVACTQDSDCLGGAKDFCAGSTEWAQYWLVWAKLKLAWLEEIFEVGDTIQVLDAAISAGPSAECDPAKGKGCGTDCTGGVVANHVFRPNLCSFGQLTFPQCKIHSCNLAAGSGASIQPLGLPVGLEDRKVTLQLCRPLAGVPGLPVDSGIRPIIGDPGVGFRPAPVVPILGGIRVCIDQVRAQGFCDCNGDGIPFEPTACQDHIQNDNDDGDPNTVDVDDCGFPVGTDVEPDCVCGFDTGIGGPGPSCVSPVGICVICVNSEDGSRCHQGTVNGTPFGSVSGATGVGDCSVLNTIALKLVPQGICTDGMSALGQCTTGGPGPDAMCTGLGGIACLDGDGPDGITCTSDDLVPPASPTSIPFTTGVSTSIITDQVATQGSCSIGGMNCATDDDCGDDQGTCTGAALATIVFSAGPGSGISCDNLESSNLTGWNIVGSFPALDGAGNLNDTVTTFSLLCE